MLLRSSSAPILHSWIPQSKESQEYESVVPPQIPIKTRSMSLSFPSSSSIFSSDSESPLQKHSENDLKEHSVRRRKSFDQTLSSYSVKEVEEPELDVEVIYSRSSTIDTIFSSSGLDRIVVNKDEGGVNVKETVLATLSMGGGFGNDGGRKICCGGGGAGRNEDRNSESSKSVNNNMESYYENMIQTNPGNPLFLSNYAKFLKEVKCDFLKAEEYCERAILSNPNDGNVLSVYADIIWKASKDAPRAESYFDQAVQAAPNDCFVAASYARFLWDAEEDDEQEAEEDDGTKDSNNILQSNFFEGTPLTAAA